MRRLRFLLAFGVCAVAATALASPASAQQPPRHPHMLVLGVQFDETGEPVAFRRCVNLAGNRRIPLNAHHAHLHVGRAGEVLFTRAGHLVVPGAPVSPWANCAELVDFFFGD